MFLFWSNIIEFNGVHYYLNTPLYSLNLMSTWPVYALVGVNLTILNPYSLFQNGPQLCEFEVEVSNIGPPWHSKFAKSLELSIIKLTPSNILIWKLFWFYRSSFIINRLQICYGSSKTNNNSSHLPSPQEWSPQKHPKRAADFSISHASRFKTLFIKQYPLYV